MEKFENYTDRNPGRILKNFNSEEIRSFMQVRKTVKILGTRLKSLEGLFIQRICFAASSVIFINLYGLLFEMNLILLSMVVGIIMYFLPFIIIKNKIANTKKEIAFEIPDIVDILSSLVKAGLNPDQALDYICGSFNCEVSSLLRLVKLKVFEGYSKKDAFYEVAKKSLSSEFETVAKILVQSDLIGNPISKALRDISRTIRNNQKDSLKIRAERLESNLIIVVFIFMFIPMMVLFLLPVMPQIKVLFN
ncbi:MAG: type II secretion system F family protein [Actinobacteria bacterium]|nr:type II secretion system F family protein [Actinomycetota bacterium]